ncbi:hypothetical protein H6P81_018106 [Aristolochia fimbriata]|uniref:Uncharacterized protein n=1 Tax=Aristolochia fimbriata TaxID=158543 RepID=A0AAV7E0G3_ARIFI|nr:hypothetical protein H6P81_018106 [Aristolochia fimbriata]
MGILQFVAMGILQFVATRILVRRNRSSPRTLQSAATQKFHKIKGVDLDRVPRVWRNWDSNSTKPEFQRDATGKLQGCSLHSQSIGGYTVASQLKDSSSPRFNHTQFVGDTLSD